MSRPPFLDRPPQVTDRSLTTRRGAFAVLDAEPTGTCRGTVLLVPGFTGSKEDFIALLAPLAEAGYRAVAVDGRGQYESHPPRDRQGYRIGALAQDVLAQSAALLAASPAVASGAPPGLHLVGHSLGGLISRGAVLRDAAPFRSLTLLSSGPARVARLPRWRTRAFGAALPLLGPERVWRALHRREGTDPVSVFMRRRWLTNHGGQLRALGRQLRYEPDRVDRLAATGVPVHVVSGEQDHAWPLPLMDEMAVRLGARRTVVEGAAHSPNAERPVPTAAAFLAFWREVEASPVATPATVRARAAEAPDAGAPDAGAPATDAVE
ncbi:alpha/beta fold hydrolase [Streptomyces bohaiensis]|uniref:Alpha/beta hydrolase n=1 Tax=Streptomyces bohaiensis TaxID=1431344 RepID=A0ABX1CHD5_9ACTN|nr:alpha/beta fold hydrolase [Streptomyces bohaiensis]NJQ15859.1 alpha/beta hydrolase [Streptomyces bohaiensis]